MSAPVSGAPAPGVRVPDAPVSSASAADAGPDLAFEVADIDCTVLEAPLRVPRRNAFGTMRSRPALLVRLRSADGAEGWGEAFCNWPPFAAGYRRRIVEELLAPLVVGRAHASPRALRLSLEAATRRLRLQCGDRGAFDQAIAGVEIAAWRAVEARTGRPLAVLLAPPGGAPAPVPVYASALTSETIDALVPPLVEAGWTGFKVKVGFGAAADSRALERLRTLVGPDARLMADANQRWDLPEAIDAVTRLVDHDVAWLEEPLPADAPSDDWARLAEASAVPLAAGENLAGRDALVGAFAGGALAVVQPDPIKWGGLSGSIEVVEAARGAGMTADWCPHYLGGGVGLGATAALACARGATWLEVDVTENPLRDGLCGALPIEGGAVAADALGDGGPDGEALALYRTDG